MSTTGNSIWSVRNFRYSQSQKMTINLISRYLFCPFHRISHVNHQNDGASPSVMSHSVHILTPDSRFFSRRTRQQVWFLFHFHCSAVHYTSQWREVCCICEYVAWLDDVARLMRLSAQTIIFALLQGAVRITGIGKGVESHSFPESVSMVPDGRNFSAICILQSFHHRSLLYITWLNGLSVVMGCAH